MENIERSPRTVPRTILDIQPLFLNHSPHAPLCWATEQTSRRDSCRKERRRRARPCKQTKNWHQRRRRNRRNLRPNLRRRGESRALLCCNHDIHAGNKGHLNKPPCPNSQTSTRNMNQKYNQQTTENTRNGSRSLTTSSFALMLLSRYMYVVSGNAPYERKARLSGNFDARCAMQRTWRTFPRMSTKRCSASARRQLTPSQHSR